MYGIGGTVDNNFEERKKFQDRWMWKNEENRKTKN